MAAMASHEMPWFEVTRLWLEYLELVDPWVARKIRRILKHAEEGAAKTADELFPAACCPLSDQSHGLKSCGMHLPTIIRELLRLRSTQWLQ